MDAEAEVASPVARYRLGKVDDALILVRRAMGAEPEAVEVVVGWAAKKLSTHPPNRWVRWTRHFLKTLKGEATEAEYCDFLEGLLADARGQLEVLRGRVSDPGMGGSRS